MQKYKRFVIFPLRGDKRPSHRIRHTADTVYQVSASVEQLNRSDDCKAAGILLKNTVDKKTLAFAKPQGLENALTNIILNAIEHAECTEITISIKTDKNKVLLTVKDNGKGIPDGPDVFRPYISENKPDVGGLGLYICKNIIESMNGELTYSCNGRTAFTVALLKA